MAQDGGKAQGNGVIRFGARFKGRRFGKGALGLLAVLLLAGPACGVQAEDFRVLYVQGNLAFEQGDFASALSRYQAAEQLAPDVGLPVWGEANCLYEQGHKPEALAAYRRALALMPTDATLAARVRAVQAELAPSAPRASASAPSSPGKGSPGTAPSALGTPRRPWWSPLWRSALLPGWGQAYNGQDTKAWLLGGAAWASYAGVAATYFTGSAVEHEYETTQSPSVAVAKYNEAYQYYIANQTFYIVFGFAYVYELADAALNANTVPQRQALLPGGVNLALLPQGALLSKEWTW